MAETPLGPLMVDVEGLELTAEECEFLSHPAIGAVILFARNYSSRDQVAALARDIRSVRSPALLIAVDQEGGRVQRFRDGFCTLPPAAALGMLHEQAPATCRDTVRTAGRLMATELRRAGIDFSFAPVLDCFNADSEVIGDRAFHHDPAVVTDLAREYIEGMHQAGMAATGKHFPGHGGVAQDSHHALPVDPRTLEQVLVRDLVPYRELAAALGGVMTAHVLYDQIDERLPTFSPFWLQQVLREELGFRGVVFSDDLSMAGAGIIEDPLHRCRAALDAGCDMALICNDPQTARQVAERLPLKFQPVPGRLESMRAAPAGNDMDTTAMAATLDAAISQVA